jgi:hypothetical protein
LDFKGYEFSVREKAEQLNKIKERKAIRKEKHKKGGALEKSAEY